MAGVKHTTSADGSFSPAGAAAWQEEHTLSDVASQTDLNTLSNALSILSATNSTEHAGLSNRITSVAGLAGGGGSVTSAEAQAISAAAQSAINTVSAAVNAVSNAVSAETAARISADNVLSAAINVVSNAGSAEIANRISADNVLSAAIAGQSVRTDSVYNAVSALINRVSANSGAGGAGSVTSQELSIATTLLSERINSAIAKTDNLSDSLSQVAAAIGDAMVFADDELSLRINSAFAATSNYASVASNAASVAVQAASVASAAALALFAPQIRIVSNTQSTNGSALVDISGLVLTVAADQTWEINGMLLVSASAATVGFKGGCSVPVLSLPRYLEFLRLSTGQSAGVMGGGGLLQVSGASQLLSLANLGGVLVGITYQGVFNVASAGTFRMMYAGIASTAASPVHIMPGSYMKAIRLK